LEVLDSKDVRTYGATFQVWLAYLQAARGEDERARGEELRERRWGKYRPDSVVGNRHRLSGIGGRGLFGKRADSASFRCAGKREMPCVIEAFAGRQTGRED